MTKTRASNSFAIFALDDCESEKEDIIQEPSNTKETFHSIIDLEGQQVMIFDTDNGRFYRPVYNPSAMPIPLIVKEEIKLYNSSKYKDDTKNDIINSCTEQCIAVMKEKIPNLGNYLVSEHVRTFGCTIVNSDIIHHHQAIKNKISRSFAPEIIYNLKKQGLIFFLNAKEDVVKLGFFSKEIESLEKKNARISSCVSECQKVMKDNFPDHDLMEFFASNRVHQFVCTFVSPNIALDNYSIKNQILASFSEDVITNLKNRRLIFFLNAKTNIVHLGLSKN